MMPGDRPEDVVRKLREEASDRDRAVVLESRMTGEWVTMPLSEFGKQVALLSWWEDSRKQELHGNGG